MDRRRGRVWRGHVAFDSRKRDARRPFERLVVVDGWRAGQLGRVESLRIIIEATLEASMARTGRKSVSDLNANSSNAADASTRFNTLAVVSFIVTITSVCPPLAMILGHVARRQIRRTGERGRALTSVSIFFGTFFSLLLLVWVLLFVVGSWFGG